MKPLTLKVLIEAVDMRSPARRRADRYRRINQARINMTRRGELDMEPEGLFQGQGVLARGADQERIRRLLNKANNSHALSMGQEYYHDMTGPGRRNSQRFRTPVNVKRVQTTHYSGYRPMWQREQDRLARLEQERKGNNP